MSHELIYFKICSINTTLTSTVGEKSIEHPDRIFCMFTDNYLHYYQFSATSLYKVSGQCKDNERSKFQRIREAKTMCFTQRSILVYSGFTPDFSFTLTQQGEALKALSEGLPRLNIYHYLLNICVHRKRPCPSLISSQCNGKNRPINRTERSTEILRGST